MKENRQKGISFIDKYISFQSQEKKIIQERLKFMDNTLSRLQIDVACSIPHKGL